MEISVQVFQAFLSQYIMFQYQTVDFNQDCMRSSSLSKGCILAASLKCEESENSVVLFASHGCHRIKK